MLRATFEDLSLSSSEDADLRDVLADLAIDPDALRFVRNKAFDIAREVMPDSDSQDIMRWLEKIMKAIDAERHETPAINSIAEFSPGDDCLNRILAMIRLAHTSIDVCVFTISDDRISDALLAAHKKKKRIRIITDDDKAYDKGSDIHRLHRAGVPVVTDDSPNHMHHKFALFDEKLLLTGSFNWTRSATPRNRENIAITNDPTLVRAFLSEFRYLWSDLNAMQ